MRRARTEEDKGLANIKLLEFQAKLKYDETDPFKPEEEKGYAREMQKRLELLKIKIKSWDDDLPHPLKPEEEKGCAVEKKTYGQYREENKDRLDIKKTYGWDTYGNRAGLDTLDGFCSSSQYADLNEIYGYSAINN